MRILVPILAGLWCTALGAQQEPAPPSRPSPQERLADLQQQQKKLFADWQQAMRAARQAAEEAAKNGNTIPALPMRPDLAPLIKVANAAAADYAGTDEAVPFLVWLVQAAAGADKAAFAAALTTLADQHKDHRDLRALGRNLGALISSPDRLGLDAAVAKDIVSRLQASADTDVRGWALLALHQATIEKGDRDGDDYKAARANLLAAAAAAEGKDLAGEIRGAIDLRERLGVGNIAPEIEGTDLDGVAFKLSDYKGKVVFLDFWGDW